MTRTIFHIDLDSFFVSAERLRTPSLKGRPIAVGGDGPRGVISSASYEARALGVRSAQPTARALKLCPTLLVVRPDFSLYSRLSQQVFEALGSFSPIVEATGIDEGFVDMTGTESLWGTPLEAAQKIRTTIQSKLGLTVSIGIASNRLVAKIATDQCKPNGMLKVERGTEAKFLEPLAVSVLPGCGRVTQKWLFEREIKTIGQLQRYNSELLEKHLGKFGIYLFESAWGKGSTEFFEQSKVRSISREHTFAEDLADPMTLKNILRSMCSELGRELREAGDYARGVRIKLRYPPFHTVTRSRVLRVPTQLDSQLFEASFCLFEDNWDERTPLRLIGVAFVLGSEEKQLGLFESEKDQKKLGRIDHLRDELARRFGEKTVGFPPKKIKD